MVYLDLSSYTFARVQLPLDESSLVGQQQKKEVNQKGKR